MAGCFVRGCLAKMKRFYWFDKPNYGDILTPFILDALGVKFRREQKRERANAICIGSIAKLARPGMAVYGSGFMRKTDRAERRADWRWVRGPYSRDIVMKYGGHVPEIYGDPAMMLPLVWSEAGKVHDVGIVPHYVDYEQCKAMFPDLPVIDLVSRNAKEVTKQITECRTIISSSLHGIIAAHAYGIPAAWVPFSDKLNGDGIKFRDHYASIGLDAIPSTFDNPEFSVGSLDVEPLIRAITK